MPVFNATICSPLFHLSAMCGLHGSSLSLGQQLCRILHLETVLSVQLVRSDHAYLLDRGADIQISLVHLWSRCINRGFFGHSNDHIRVFVCCLPRVFVCSRCFLRPSHDYTKPNADDWPSQSPKWPHRWKVSAQKRLPEFQAHIRWAFQHQMVLAYCSNKCPVGRRALQLIYIQLTSLFI